MDSAPGRSLIAVTHTDSKLLYSATMSVDGFIAGVNGDMSWLTEHLASGPEIDELTASIGALLVGRRTYSGDDPNRGTDAEGAFGGQWHGQTFVLTHDPASTGEEADVTFLDDLPTAVAPEKAAANGRYVNVLGTNVANQCLGAGLLDEVLVFIAPVLLGDGTRLFHHAGGTNVRLEPSNQTRRSDLHLVSRLAVRTDAGRHGVASVSTRAAADTPAAQRSEEAWSSNATALVSSRSPVCRYVDFIRSRPVVELTRRHSRDLGACRRKLRADAR